MTSAQGLGLAFDANDFPVISFTTQGGKIWLAYDPAMAVPEPCTLVLLAAGGVLMMLFSSYRRK